MLPLAFKHTQPCRVVGQVGNRVTGFASMVRLGEVVEAAIDHLQGKRRERLVESFGHGIGQVDQDGMQQPGGPQLKLDAVGGFASTPASAAESRAEPAGTRGPETLRQGLWADLPRFGPQQALGAQHLGQLRHLTDLAPNRAQHQHDHE